MSTSLGKRRQKSASSAQVLLKALSIQFNNHLLRDCSFPTLIKSHCAKHSHRFFHTSTKFSNASILLAIEGETVLMIQEWKRVLHFSQARYSGWVWLGDGPFKETLLVHGSANYSSSSVIIGSNEGGLDGEHGGIFFRMNIIRAG